MFSWKCTEGEVAAAGCIKGNQTVSVTSSLHVFKTSNIQGEVFTAVVPGKFSLPEPLRHRLN